MQKINKILCVIIFLLLQSICICQIALSDSVLQKRIVGKWILVSDEIGERTMPFFAKNDTTFFDIKANGSCNGYLVNPFNKYEGTWVIKNKLLNINYTNKTIEYWFQIINDTSLIITTMRPHIGSCNRTFKRFKK
ncbi:MAG TPA: lipocalin family protein [Bacteroidia bacterium]|jgi:hypothetical protein|nr:lipocalin family protein [Bacteroidia bacterium]